ncbi:ABC transporter substrate-binding protein [Cohnella suwonensis]|uniref:ABC transporter substrate-binding protein n=1 Tax=Cohnella suwonensis TaxID=696072 RepID=A0ABW0M1P3_9BACL
MKRFSRACITLLLSAVLILVLSACRSDTGNAVTVKPQTSIKVYISADTANNEIEKKINDAFTAKTGIKVEYDVVPGDDMYKKIDMDLASSASTTDVIPLTNPLPLDKYVKNGYLLPLNELLEADHYDADQIHGKYLTKYEGLIYSLPDNVSMWAVFYNKKIFDDADVPYPPSEWTWEQYIDTAQKLNDPSKGIYGSYMLDFDIYLFMLARQHNISAYKADGTSNYDDPIFKESLKFFGDLGNVHKIQPSWLDYQTNKLQWDGFMSGNYGMHLIGNWYTGLLTNSKDFPKDWKWGVTQIPTDGKGTNNFGVAYNHAVNKRSTHPKEALEYVKFKAQYAANMRGILPALADPAAQAESVKQIAELSNGSVTVDDLSKAFFDNRLGYVQEKNIGPAAAEYSTIILQESDLYLRGERSLDKTVQAIQEKADAAILKEMNKKE